ncbi:uncharacterized protein B0H18DRAFT_960356 [Fomitopsis serialis]|uniref:uncharacterized protein n=1 Tax=Fomitopsis serialis TaxID=139415 RepID=UPI0020086EBF|nr:uncharacterized protein B0H18DRAFT_960356 [Neoantrodia serialis]KAH9913445.1 hypothetical protein B0H18DRAFT_960356 [Neoantrodia serialis]
MCSRPLVAPSQSNRATASTSARTLSDDSDIEILPGPPLPPHTPRRTQRTPSDTIERSDSDNESEASAAYWANVEPPLPALLPAASQANAAIPPSSSPLSSPASVSSRNGALCNRGRATDARLIRATIAVDAASEDGSDTDSSIDGDGPAVPTPVASDAGTLLVSKPFCVAIYAYNEEGLQPDVFLFDKRGRQSFTSVCTRYDLDLVDPIALWIGPKRAWRFVHVENIANVVFGLREGDYIVWVKWGLSKLPLIHEVTGGVAPEWPDRETIWEDRQSIFEELDPERRRFEENKLRL